MKAFCLFVVCLFFLFYSGCEQETEWEYSKATVRLIVVDGMITNEIKAHEIKISKTVSSLNEKPSPVTGAKVTLYNNLIPIVLNETPENSGIYITPPEFFAEIGRLYRLVIQYDNKRFIAEARMVAVNPIQSLQYKKNVDNDLYQISYVAPPYDKNDASMYEIILDWSHLPAYTNINKELCRKKVYYYTLKSVDLNQIFAPPTEKIEFPKGTIITEKKYSLTDRHAEFFRSLLSETQWRGGFFDVSQANVPSNFSEGALGYFGVCMVLSTTITVQ